MDKKEAIRKAAIKVMAKEGFYNTKMQSIADEAGIAIGTVYLYFKSKEAILDYIFKIEYEKRLEFIENLKNSNMPFLQQLINFLTFHLCNLINYPDAAKVLIQESIDPALHKLEWINKAFSGIPKIFRQLLDNAKESGEIRDIDSDIIGSTIFFSSRALAYKMQKEGRENEYEYAFEQFTSFVINGIKV